MSHFSFQIQWSSTSDKCQPKGLCGLNGYCILTNQQTACNCLPGFEYIDQNHKSKGCQRNFTADACGNKTEHANYNMYTLESTIWEGTPFSNLSTITKEDYRNNCSGDCNYEAALFKDGECTKQMLPVIYGRRDVDDSTTAFVKVGSGSPVSRNDTQVDKECDKKELRKDILIICVSLAACALIILAITSVLIYRHRVWTHRKLSSQGDVELTKDITL